jgi:bifunctional non-homologous end joining protein LigD
VAEREVRLTSPDRVLYPAAGFTKRDLVDYYRAVADVLLPHIAGRPLTLGRWPSGVDARGFAQMECRGAPEWMKTQPLELLSGEIRNYCIVDDLPSLLWVANLSTIELHPYPVRGIAIFDLDPKPPAGLAEAANAAQQLRVILERRGLEGLPKTSGGDGLHVFARLDAPLEFEQVRALCIEVAAELDAPAINVDCLANHPRRSLVAPYSLRAADVPVVSTPVTWDEVADGRLVFGPDEVRARIDAHGDLWSTLAP